MTASTVLLDEARWLEFYPTLYRPITGDEKLAALAGYMIGDGSIALRSQKYVKKDGGVSVYAPTLVGAFYSKDETDLLEIKGALADIGMALKASVTRKKTPAHLDDGYQIQLSSGDCKLMVDAGVPVGKKTTLTFEVPNWIKKGDLAVKRAFLAALFGAEGTTPASTRGGVRTMRPIVMTMHKIAPTAPGEFFKDVQDMLADLGVEATLTSNSANRYNKTYVGYSIRISGLKNIIAYLSSVGYAFCEKKGLAGWKWLKYLKAYEFEAKRRRSTVQSMSDAGASYAEIGASLGLTRGAAFRLLKDIQEGKGNTAGHSFPTFDTWIGERWLETPGVLRLKTVSCKPRAEPVEVWNLLVSSHDHSYLLANGVNNFNSFETMSGRVYYPFDRSVHIQPVEFNPKLPIWVGMDFNIDPMSTVIYQPQLNGELWAVDEIVLFGSNTEEVCEELEKRFWRHQNQIVMYPDPAGGQRQHARGETDMDILREKGFKRIKYRKKHPMVADRVNAVNRMLKDANGAVRLKVNPRCKHFISALEQTIYKKGTREVDKSAGTEHSADAGGYCIELEFPVRKVEIGGLSI